MVAGKLRQTILLTLIMGVLITLACKGPLALLAATATPTATATATPTSTPTPVPTATATLIPPYLNTSDGGELGVVIEEVLDNGWTYYEVPEQGFAVQVPPSWLRISLEAEQLDEAASLLDEESAEFAGFAEEQIPALMSVAGGGFFAIDTTPDTRTGGYSNNLSILRLADLPGLTLERLGDLMVGVLGLMEISSDATQEYVALPAGESVRLRYVVELGTSSGAVAAQVAQYWMVFEDDIYVLTFGTTAASLSEDEALTLTLQIAETFEVLR